MGYRKIHLEAEKAGRVMKALWTLFLVDAVSIPDAGHFKDYLIITKKY
jgi:hypothetical protein